MGTAPGVWPKKLFADPGLLRADPFCNRRRPARRDARYSASVPKRRPSPPLSASNRRALPERLNASRGPSVRLVPPPPPPTPVLADLRRVTSCARLRTHRTHEGRARGAKTCQTNILSDLCDLDEATSRAPYHHALSPIWSFRI